MSTVDGRNSQMNRTSWTSEVKIDYPIQDSTFTLTLNCLQFENKALDAKSFLEYFILHQKYFLISKQTRIPEAMRVHVRDSFVTLGIGEKSMY
jgi:hypothetical protein